MKHGSFLIVSAVDICCRSDLTYCTEYNCQYATCYRVLADGAVNRWAVNHILK